MPRKKRKAVMKPSDFRQLLKDAGLTIREAADRLGVGIGTVSRWQTGKTPIAKSSAQLIRAVIQPKTQ